jgi:sugar lactone lactonase YvrE
MGRRVTAILLTLLLAGQLAFAVEEAPVPRWVGIFPLKDRIGLKWVDVPKATGYLVQRKKGGDVAWKEAATVKVSSWVDQNVITGVYYHYRIVAILGPGKKSDPSEERYARLSPSGKESVSEPEWVGILVRPGGVGLKWAPGDGGTPVVYNIYRKRDREDSYTLLGSSDTTGFLDERVTVGETYVYQVKAIGSDFLEGPGSVERRVSFIPALPTPDLPVRFFPAEPFALPRSDKLGFRSPTDLAFDYRGLLYVSDTNQNRVVAIDRAKGWVRDIGVGLLRRPLGIGVSPEGTLAVSEAGSSTVRVYDRDGGFKLAIDCRKFGKGEECGLSDAAWDPITGNLAIVDNLNARIFIVSKDGTLRLIVGERGSSPGRMLAPGLAAYSQKGDLFVVDQLRCVILVYGGDGVFKQEFGGRGRGYGNFGRPKGIAIDASGRCFVTDGLLNTVQVFLTTGQPLGYLSTKEGEPIDTTTPSGIAVGQGNEVILAEKLIDRLAGFLITDLAKLEQAGRDAALRSTGKIAPGGVATPAVISPTPTPTPSVRPLLPVRPIGPIPVPTFANP